MSMIENGRSQLIPIAYPMPTAPKEQENYLTTLCKTHDVSHVLFATATLWLGAVLFKSYCIVALTSLAIVELLALIGRSPNPAPWKATPALSIIPIQRAAIAQPAILQ